MVKKCSVDTAEESDVDVVQEWLEEAPTRLSTKRGPNKTYKGVAVKTEQEKKEAAARRQKRYMMNKKTQAARECAEANQ